MKTIQMTIDEELLDDVDAVVSELGTNRSAFMRNALQIALRRHAIHKQEARHAVGYAKHPQKPNEFTDWEDEQVWESA